MNHKALKTTCMHRHVQIRYMSINIKYTQYLYPFRYKLLRCFLCKLRHNRWDSAVRVQRDQSNAYMCTIKMVTQTQLQVRAVTWSQRASIETYFSLRTANELRQLHLNKYTSIYTSYSAPSSTSTRHTPHHRRNVRVILRIIVDIYASYSVLSSSTRHTPRRRRHLRVILCAIVDMYVACSVLSST